MSAPAEYPKRDLAGAHVLITGGTRGIGAHVVAQLAASGAKIVSLARAPPASPVSGVEYVSCDIGSRTAVKKALEDIKTSWHYLDIIILNAGVMPGIFMDPLTVDDELEESVFAVNVSGTHFVTKYSLPLLLASPNKLERTVVLVSSSAGFLTEPEEGNGMLAYRASKAAENGLMVGLHQLYVEDTETSIRTRGGPTAPKLQRVVSVHPGFVQTGLGLESATDFSDADTYAKAKASWGAISVEAGADTILWAVSSVDGKVPSGKLLFERKVHSF